MAGVGAVGPSSTAANYVLDDIAVVEAMVAVDGAEGEEALTSKGWVKTRRHDK
jgi:hypothetical protein